MDEQGRNWGRDWIPRGLAVEPFPEEQPLIEAVRRDGRPRVRVYRVDRPMVVLGRSGRLERDLHLDAVSADGVEVFRRLGGGGAVVLDPGTVQVETAGLIEGPLRLTEWLASFSEWLAAGLELAARTGVSRRDVCDLTLGERKVAGACLYRSRNLVHYSVSVLAQAPVALMERYLRHPVRQPSYRAQRSHGAFVASLDVSAEDLERALGRVLREPSLFGPPDRGKIPGGRPGSRRRYRAAGNGPLVP